MARTRTLDTPDPMHASDGDLLAARLGPDFASEWAEVTGIPLWDDRAPYARYQRKWEQHATKLFALPLLSKTTAVGARVSDGKRPVTVTSNEVRVSEEGRREVWLGIEWTQDERASFDYVVVDA